MRLGGIQINYPQVSKEDTSLCKALSEGHLIISNWRMVSYLMY